MKKIDLGQSEKIVVTYNGEDHELREPTLEDTKVFKGVKDKDGDVAFLAFISGLGLPVDVAKGLGLSKIKFLAKEILGEIEKK